MNQNVIARRPWYRWLTQFSLRSLLILVTLSAIVCGWLLRPESQEEQLAGKHLVLRRQVRTTKDEAATAEQSAAGESGDVLRTVSDGSWQLYDRLDGLIASGNCQQDIREGLWTLYHPNGQKAAEGQVLHGARHGLWKVWDTRGNPVSEVTYQAPDTFRPSPQPAPRPYVTIPVVGSTSFTNPAVLPQFGGSGGFCGTGMMMAAAARWDQLERESLRSLRHGPCRAWHPATPTRRAGAGDSPPGTPTRRVSEGPPLAFEGQYANDERSGLWTFYDADGHVTERGHFVADRREGEWTICAPATGDEVPTAYLAGRSPAEHETLLAGIRADLASDTLRRQVAAITRLEDLGPHGWPLLTELLTHDSPELKLLALRTFVRQANFPAAALPKIEPLVHHPDERLATRAMTAVYIAQPDRRSELFDPLLAAIDPVEAPGTFEETIRAIYHCDEARRSELARSVVSRLAARLSPPDPTADLPSGWNLIGEDWLANLGEGVIPHLDAAFQQGNSQERLLVVLVLRRVVEQGPLERPFVSPPGGVPRYKVPASAQPLLRRAQADADPQVREAAATVGEWGGGNGAFYGSGGGFF